MTDFGAAMINSAATGIASTMSYGPMMLEPQAPMAGNIASTSQPAELTTAFVPPPDMLAVEKMLHVRKFYTASLTLRCFLEL